MRTWIAALLLASLPAPGARPDAAAAGAGRASLARDRGVGPSLDALFAALHGRAARAGPGLRHRRRRPARPCPDARQPDAQDPPRPVTPDSLFRIASMSKAFTALAILKLRDEGRLQLDALAETYVPGDAALALSDQRQPAHPRPRPAQPCRRLRHRRSLGRPPAGADRGRVHRACCAPACPSPARRRASSNIPISAMPCSAGSSPTSRAGRYQDYIQDEIMRPLGMASTGYDIFASPQERRALG